jgi:hypothetical protein
MYIILLFLPIFNSPHFPYLLSFPPLFTSLGWPSPYTFLPLFSTLPLPPFLSTPVHSTLKTKKERSSVANKSFSINNAQK